MKKLSKSQKKIIDKFRKEVYNSDDILRIKIDTHNLYSIIPTDIHSKIMEKLPMTGKERVLDVGCGTGEFLVFLREKNHREDLYGVDITKGVCRIGSNLSEKYNLGINFSVGYIEFLVYEDNYFDVVTAQHMLSHLSDIDKGLVEVKRVIKDHGRFVATANSLKSYPHVSKYRQKIYEIMGWGDVVFTTSKFNMENMESILSKHWRNVDMEVLEGLMKIPQAPFLKYFESNMAVWDPLPDKKQKMEIIGYVDKWSKEDLVEDCIVEPKYVAVAICSDKKT